MVNLPVFMYVSGGILFMPGTKKVKVMGVISNDGIDNFGNGEI